MDEYERSDGLGRLLLLANQGVAYAQFQVGYIYFRRGDDQEAVSWFRKAAEQGDVDAQLWLGVMYANGKGVPEDDQEAASWYYRAAEQGHAEAQFRLGVMYANGKGVPEDDQEAASWYYRAAGQGHAGAQFWLGASYAYGWGVPADDREAASWYRKAAEQGHAEAQYSLGLRYSYGRGVPEDGREAVFWYRKAAEQGHAEAQCSLGVSYADGKGVPEDDGEAVFWYRKAAEQGHARAQCYLGLMYDDGGEGVPANGQEAAFWFRKAAEQGDEDAQFYLALLYAYGHEGGHEGVPANKHEAAYWYRKAAEQGDPTAQLSLGELYADGEGVPADDQEAAFWFRKAAEQGDEDAQFRLGLSYANGEGVPEDDVQAYAWLNLASVEGGEDAQQQRTRIRQRMTSAQVAEAQQLSRQLAAWIAGDGDEPRPASISEDPFRSPSPSYDAVRQAQSYLALLGYDTGSMDGLPGERTTAAVRQFQQDQGLTPTGRVSDELLVLLRAMAGARQNQPAEPVSSGSGFLVGREGWAVTNHHVVDGHARVTVSRAGTSHDATVQVVEAFDDLALLKVSVEVGEGATFGESPSASLGEATMVAGYPLHGLLSKEFNVTTGNVSALAGPGDDPKLLQITAPVQQGNSGGPLLDGAGNVIGVVVSRLNAAHATRMTGDTPQNVNFAIKGAVVRSFLDIHGVAYDRRPSNQKLTPEQLAELAHTFTVAVHCWE